MRGTCYPQHRNCNEWTRRITNLRIGNLLAILRLAIYCYCNCASVTPKIVNIVKIPPAKLELLPLRNCPIPRVGLSERRRACLRLKFSSPSSSSLSPLNGRSRRWWWCRRWRADWPAHDIDNFDIVDDNVDVLLIMMIRGGICHSRHSRRECKIFASGVNFSRNNAVCYINESKKLHSILISSLKLLTYY